MTGHGVGVAVHERPHVFNYAHPDLKKTLYKPGMVLCFEPITSLMSTDFYQHPGNESLYTDHGDLGAQREYMVLITTEGYEVLSGIRELV